MYPEIQIIFYFFHSAQLLLDVLKSVPKSIFQLFVDLHYMKHFDLSWVYYEQFTLCKFNTIICSRNLFFASHWIQELKIQVNKKSLEALHTCEI